MYGYPRAAPQTAHRRLLSIAKTRKVISGYDSDGPQVPYAEGLASRGSFRAERAGLSE